MSIQRYAMHQYRDEAEMEPNDQGDYVLYEGHKAELEALRTERDEARRTMREAHEAGTTLAAELEALRADAAIGQLVRRKLVSGNSVPVERCHITAAEVAALEARKGAA